MSAASVWGAALLVYGPKTVQFITTVCTVDLEIPNSLAAARTVALFSIMYTASRVARCSMSVCKEAPPIDSLGKYMLVL